jgi:predicted Zn-dependent protease
MRSAIRTRWLIGAWALLAVACAKSPTGHPQLLLVSDAEMAKMGVAAFNEVKAETPPTQDQALADYVRCVAAAITNTAAPGMRWEIVTFESKEANAFALPGGKIGVFTGILGVAENQDQLATVLGHEVAHVTARHGNARVSAALAADTGVQLTSAIMGPSVRGQREILGLLGVGAQLGVLMPYGRDQETEADVLGLGYMADAGFDPAASVELWQNMKRVSPEQPPTFLSTHPSHEGRIEELTAKLPAATARYRAARQAGRAPSCPRSDGRSASAR